MPAQAHPPALSQESLLEAWPDFSSIDKRLYALAWLLQPLAVSPVLSQFLMDNRDIFGSCEVVRWPAPEYPPASGQSRIEDPPDCVVDILAAEPNWIQLLSQITSLLIAHQQAGPHVVCRVLALADRMPDRAPVFSCSDRVRLLERTWRSIISQGLWSVASVYLDDLLPLASALELRQVQASVHVMLGSALRWSGKLAEAEQHLRKALDLVPHGTAVYADALIELAVVYRYQGRGTSAEAAVRSAVSQFDQLNDEISVQRGGLELAQIAIEQRQPERALSQLPALTYSARLEAIKAEAYLLLEQTDTACEHAENALLLAKGKPPVYFRAQALLGQIQHAQGDCEAALNLLADAVQNLRHIQDEVGWARSVSSLAAILIDIGQLHESIDLIIGAIVSQEISGDVAGLKHSVQTQMQVYAALTEHMLQAGNTSAAATWGNMLAQAHHRWETLRG